MQEQNFIDLITFWRDVEALTPQKIPKKAPNDKTAPTGDWVFDSPPPWLDPDFKRRPIASTNAWRHTVYAALYERPRFIELLEWRLGKPPEISEDPPGGQSCVFSIAIDEHGRPLIETMMISMAAWAFGIIEGKGLAALPSADACDIAGLHSPEGKYEVPRSNSGFPGFDSQLDKLREDLAWQIESREDARGIDFAEFDEFVVTVIDRLNLRNLVGVTPFHRVKSVQVRRPDPRKPLQPKTPKSEDDFLNSFCIKDLNRLIAGSWGRVGVGFRHFLEPPAGISRIDVRTDRGRAIEVLCPSNSPAGCWPAEHPLVWSQQVAINAAWQDLQTEGCFAVNGPPGTGKTTLLRDVVAAIVVERAKLLARKGSALLSSARMLDIGGKSIPYYPLDPSLSGYSIVVASSNNGALDNVSLELPKRDAIHNIWSGAVDAYSDIAGALLGQPAWAMVAGRLGDKEKREFFVKTFWWAKGEEREGVAGLRKRLQAIKEGSARPAVEWAEAVSRFNQAIATEQDWRQRLVKLSQLPAALNTLEMQHGDTEWRLAAAASKHAESVQQIAAIRARIADAGVRMQRVSARVDTLRRTKPGVLEWISTFGKAQREWRADLRKAMAEMQSTEGEEIALMDRCHHEELALTELNANLAELSLKSQKLTAALEEMTATVARAEEMLGAAWPDLAASEPDQERSSPWAYPDWRAARIEVFLAAMNLHHAFIEANAAKMLANIGIAMDVLLGGIPDPKIRALAFDSLAIACPVISTTFASTPALFGDLGPGSIGWLLIDEAGQAAPPIAAGAIWRAQRVLVVGDPLQLEPVRTLPRAIEVALAACHGNIARHWHPSRTSVQQLADQATRIGTTLKEHDGEIWVGAPLRVHRRCDEPMFTISNTLAYNGMMVHQKTPSPARWPASRWVDVPKAYSLGNWIPAEGDALRTLLHDLIYAQQVPAGEIFLTSPFRDVVRELEGIGKSFALDYRRVGTVHTTQGKESELVILVLGGGSGKARRWASGKPNLLNVAVSRAKTRIYVIGDRADWSTRPHYDVLARIL